jgi:hypothetical protein
MAQFPFGDFLDAFKAALDARPGLAGVTVYTYDPSPDVDMAAVIVLGSGQITGNTPWAALGQLRRTDEMTITATVAATRPGAGETVAKAARDRAEALAVEVLEELKTLPAVGDNTLKADDIGYVVDQVAAELAGVASRICFLDLTFTISVRVT